MTELTGTKLIYAIDQDRMAAMTSVNQVLNIIRDYIPRACIREVEGVLFDAFFINGVELTSNTMRKEYEAWKQIDLRIPETMIWPK